MFAVLVEHGGKHFLVDVHVKVGILVGYGFEGSHYPGVLIFHVKVQDGKGQLHQFGAVKERFHEVGLCAVHLTAVL